MWRLNPRCSLHYRNWGNDWAIFDVGSGQTHAINTVTAVALMHCENGWVALKDLGKSVMADLELPLSYPIAEVLMPLLQQFAAMELLEHKTNELVESDR